LVLASIFSFFPVFPFFVAPGELRLLVDKWDGTDTLWDAGSGRELCPSAGGPSPNAWLS
jgi:hypothetical protein